MTDAEFEAVLEGVYEGRGPCEACDETGMSNTRPGEPCLACDGLGWREP